MTGRRSSCILAVILCLVLLPAAACGNRDDGEDAMYAPGIVIEAEDGVLDRPMEIGDDRMASGGRFVSQAGASNAGEAAYRLEISQSGFYQLKGRAQAAGRSGDSFTVQFDETPPMLWQLSPDAEGWADAVGPQAWLEAGEHSLRIEYREAGAKLDSLRLDLASAGASAATWPGNGATWYVSPDGDDGNSGRSDDAAFATIQHALQQAQPGDTIRLAKGEYREDVRSIRAGLPGRPITIEGPSNAVIKGAGDARIVELNHGNITLRGFTVDGLDGDAGQRSSYRDKLVYVQGTQALTPLLGIRLLDMTLRNAGGECVRLRYYVQQTEIAGNTISSCGVYDFRFDDGGKNGEAIYIGTSSTQWADGNNPTPGPDLTSEVWVHHNSIDTRGNECVDIKEGSFGNIVEENSCRGQLDENSGGFGARGDDNIFRNNTSSNNEGAGFRLGGHRLCLDPDGVVVFDFDDGEQSCAAPYRVVEYGIDNQVYANEIKGNDDGGIAIEVSPQTLICGNDVSGNDGGDTAGEFRRQYHPGDEC